MSVELYGSSPVILKVMKPHLKSIFFGIPSLLMEALSSTVEQLSSTPSEIDRTVVPDPVSDAKCVVNGSTKSAVPSPSESVLSFPVPPYPSSLSVIPSPSASSNHRYVELVG